MPFILLGLVWSALYVHMKMIIKVFSSKQIVFSRHNRIFSQFFPSHNFSMR
jgi:drug/metabolite transporter (DMT)-like permease